MSAISMASQGKKENGRLPNGKKTEGESNLKLWQRKKHSL